jgi:hypothetical protein
MNREYSQGDLVRIVSQGSLTLGIASQTTPLSLRECPTRATVSSSGFAGKNKWEDIEGKVALVVYVLRNRLNQVIGYHLLFESRRLFCKANVAQKYFEKVDLTDASRRFSEIQNA